MVERVREVKVEVIIDTNKQTHMQTFDIMDYTSLDELFSEAKKFAKEILQWRKE